MDGAEKTRPSRAHIIIIVAVAYAVRLAYLWSYRKHPFFTNLLLDPRWHDIWAKEIAAGDWLGKEVFFRAPLYPYMLALLYKLTGTGMVAARLWQFAMGTAGAVLTYLLGIRLLGERRYALGAGLAFALYGPMIYFEGELLIPSLIVLLDMLALYVLYLAVDKKRSRLFALSGFVFGMSCIARPNVLVPVAALTLWIAYAGEKDSKRGLLKRAMPFFVAFMLLPGLVTVRNGIVGGDYVFVASQGGANFYIGNNPVADGKSIRGIEAAFSEMEGEYRDSIAHSSKLIAERDLRRPLKPSEISSYWFSKSFNWMKRNPKEAALLFLKKMFFMIRGHEGGSNRDVYASHEFSPVTKFLMWEKGVAFPAGLVIPLALAGMIMAWPRRKTWAPLYIFTILYAGTIILFFVNSRYRMPLVGPMLLFAVLAVKDFVSIAVSGKKVSFAALALFVIAMAVLSNWGTDAEPPGYEYRRHFHLGRYYEDNGNPEKAMEEYRKALDISPNNPFVFHRLGVMAFDRKDYATAEKYFHISAIAQPNNPTLRVYYGNMLEGRGNLDGAISEYRAALEIDPGHDRAKKSLERAMARKRSMRQ